ncbi:MAG: DUF5702 domain-containing protein [Clostridiales bacterium]|nr:DUF5702 domain-containing protein [Clostridiales bacterium]
MRKKGSITLSLALLITAFFSAVFAFLEAGRVSGLAANAEISTAQATDTVLASYQRELWQNYRLMFWEAPDGDIPGFTTLESLEKEAIEGDRADSIIGDNYYVLPIHLKDMSVTSYQLVSDKHGEAFREQAEEMMKKNLASTVADDLLDWIAGQDTDDEGDDLEEVVLDVLDNLEDSEAAARAAAEADSADGGSSESSSGTAAEISHIKIEENPLKWVKNVAKNGILAIVMPDSSFSSKAIDSSYSTYTRSLETGNTTVSSDDTALQSVWFYIYLDEYFNDATEDSDDHALDYELEYMIAGKDTDQANLKAVVRKILLMREAANMLYLETHEDKKAEVTTVAGIISAAALSPGLEPLVEQGMLAAWAYAESISDVRILLEGGKVALVKTEEQWHTDLASLPSTVMATEGKDQTKGLSYSNYLEILLASVNTDKLTCRAMDIVENNLDIKMDQMLAYAECDYTYQSDALFWNFVTLGSDSPGAYSFTEQADISFLKLSE